MGFLVQAEEMEKLNNDGNREFQAEYQALSAWGIWEVIWYPDCCVLAIT